MSVRYIDKNYIIDVPRRKSLEPVLNISKISAEHRVCIERAAFSAHKLRLDIKYCFNYSMLVSSTYASNK